MAALRDLTERGSKTHHGGTVGRQSEAQEIVGPVEAAAPDVPLRQRSVNPFRAAMSRKTKQRCSANDLEPGLCEHSVERAGLTRKETDCLCGPGAILQGRGADLQRRAGTGPRPQRARDLRDDRRRGDGKAQPNSGETVELSERPQNDDRQIRTQSDCTDGGIDIRKGFIDHKPSAALRHPRSQTGDRIAIDDPSVGVVRIDDHGVNGSGGEIAGTRHCNDVMTRLAPSHRVFAVGRFGDGDWSLDREIRQPLNDRLRAGGGADFHSGRNGVSPARRIAQSLLIGMRWQTVPRPQGQFGNRPRPWIDSRGEIEPHVRRAAVTRHRLREIAAMFHSRFMPSSAGKREGKWQAFAMLLLALGWLAAPHPTQAEELPRIASINLCTDQLLVTLADPGQILGLSPYARDPARSWDAAKAAQFPLLSGDAEDVLVLKPDVVVAGRFTKRATRELLKDKGLRVAEFDPARSLDDVKKQLRQMGALVKHPERADAEIAKIDSAIAHARQIAARKPYRVLAVSRRGWVSGGDNLTTSLLSAVGLKNAGGELGLKAGGYASLEAIITLKPDFLLVSESSDFAEDEGRAFLLHPALERFYPPSKRIVIPERLVNCGGPTLTAALDRLAAELERVDR
jgi:iron complex transport system substrate-binding protein